MKNLLFTFIFTLTFSAVFSQVVSEWRGPGRSGSYLEEKELLKKWPEGGPELLWHLEDVPKGYSSVVIAHDKLFVTGISDGMDHLLAYDLNGNLLWQTAYGRAWDSSYENSRCSPTVTEKHIYVSSGLGDMACVDADSGKIIWSNKCVEENEGKVGRFGFSESPLVYKDIVLFTPAGNKTTIVAYNRFSGEIKWKSESLNDRAAYSSPLLLENNKISIAVNFTENYLFGVDLKDGRMLWKYDFGQYSRERNNQTNTPLHHNNELFLTSGYDHKSVMLSISENLMGVQEKWTDSILDVHHGGVVLVDGYIYGSNWTNNSNGNWCCIEWDNGKLKYEEEWNNKGSIIYADGMLYIYDEKRGNMGLVKPDPEKFEVVSSFKVPYGRGPHWAHPVIKNGVLYIRHENAVMAYNIKK